jgi:prevent-host-death family protein
MIAERIEAKSVSIAEAKRRLSELLKQAREEPVIITRRNEPDSVIVPYEDYVSMRRIQAYQSIVRLSKQTKATGVSLQDILDESRRELEERGL